MKLLILGFIAMLCACVSASPNSKRAPASDSDVVAHIIATTDVHGYILAQLPASGKGLATGGIDVMSGYFKIAKQADPNTMLLDSGDLFQGTIVSNTTDGAPVVTWMNYAGYLAAAIGNHDFDFGPGNGSSRVVRSGQDPLGALKAREIQAQFKFLSANICSLDEDPNGCTNPASFSNASFTQPFMMQTIQGARIGIIGLTTPSTPHTTLPANVARLKFFPLASTLERYVPMLKSQGADAIIVIAHEGGYCEKGVCSPTDPVFAMIDQLTPSTRQNVSTVLAGHTHNFVNTVYNGVPLTLNGSYGRSFGYVTLIVHNPGQASTVSVATKTVDFCAQVYSDTHTCNHGSAAPEPATFLGQPIVPDPQALQLIASDIDNANLVSNRVVGKLVTAVTDNHSSLESTLGELMADSLRLCHDPSCTNPDDIGYQNNGGIRVKSIPAGPINYEQVFQTDPFDDYYSQVLLKGSQIHDLLVALYAYNHGSFGQVSGIRITYSKSTNTPRTITNPKGKTKTYPDPITLIQMNDGSVLQDDKVYKVAMADFMATGGSGTSFVFDGLNPPPTVHLELVLRDAVLDYFQANPQGLDYSKLGGGRIIQQP